MSTATTTDHEMCDTCDRVDGTHSLRCPNTTRFQLLRPEDDYGRKWLLIAEGRLTDGQVQWLTFRASPFRVTLGDRVEVRDDHETRVGYLSGATYHERDNGPAYVTCSITLR